MKNIKIIDLIERNSKSGRRIDGILQRVCSKMSDQIHTDRIRGAEELQQRLEDMDQCRGSAIITVISLDQYGWNPELDRMLHLCRQNPHAYDQSVGAVIVDGEGETYTKSVAQSIILAMNQSGCTFPGGPIVEATGSLYNFSVSAMNGSCSLQEAYQAAVQKLLGRMVEFGCLSGLYELLKSHQAERGRKILCVHASKHVTSNTLGLWELVKEKLDPSIEIKEISLENGSIQDCKGCPFQVCSHFGMQNSCYYGGAIVEEVYPALEECDTLILLCPNYNDSVSANIMAFINRLTALYRKRQFYDKQFYAIIVSGYSGGDLVARQLISALNINKTFILPARFSMIETAHFPGDYRKIPDLEEKLEDFSSKIGHFFE